MKHTIMDNKLYLGLDERYCIKPGDVLEYSNIDQVVEVINIDQYNIKFKVLFDLNIPTETEAEISIEEFLHHIFSLKRVTDPEKRVKELTVKYVID
jgi:ASC-1-like (ASCH) protein